jgi:hypothetical protein
MLSPPEDISTPRGGLPHMEEGFRENRSLLKGGLQQGGKFPLLMQFVNDVTASDEFSIDINLGNGRPIGILLDPIPDGRVNQDVHGLERIAIGIQNLYGVGRKATLRGIGCALHVKNHGILLDMFIDTGQYVVCHLPTSFL